MLQLVDVIAGFLPYPKADIALDRIGVVVEDFGLISMPGVEGHVDHLPPREESYVP